MPQFTVSTEDRVYREDTLHAYQRGVERAIQVMHARLGEPLTVDDLATVAFMSRHHFTRVFAKITVLASDPNLLGNILAQRTFAAQQFGSQCFASFNGHWNGHDLEILSQVYQAGKRA